MTITCPKCDKTFEKTLFPLGPRVGCPKCGTHFDIANRDTVAYRGDADAAELPELPAAPHPSPNAATKPAPAPSPEPAAVEHSDPAAPTGEPVMPSAGDQLGQYVLEREIGRGGMGTVWLATQKSLNRKVAVKLLDARLSRDPHFVARFEREARSLASMRHPRIVSILDRGHAQGHYYFVMEHVDGPSLRQLMSSGAVSPVEALRLVPQICEALEYAHSQGVIHRDIKPENILRDKDGDIKIADFGLSRIVGNELLEPQITATNMVMGTMDYMAPEQREQSKGVDHRADIYSLGVVFYELLTGELPLGRFEPPSRRNVQVDVNLDRVVLKVLEKNPELRYQRASHVSDDIRQVQESRGLSDDAARSAKAALAGAAARSRHAAHNAQPWLEEHWGGWVFAGVMVFFFMTLCSGQWYLAFPALIGWGVMSSHLKKKTLASAGIVPRAGEDTDVLYNRHQAGLSPREGEPVRFVEPSAGAAAVELPPAPPKSRFSILALFSFLLTGVVALPVPLLFAFSPEIFTWFAGFSSDERALALTLALPVVALPLLVIFGIAVAARSRFGGRPELRGRGLASLAVLFVVAAMGGSGYVWGQGLECHRDWNRLEVQALAPEDATQLLNAAANDPITRAVVLRRLETMPSEAAAPLIERLLEDSAADGRLAAVRALGATGEAGVRRLAALLASERDFALRTQILASVDAEALADGARDLLPQFAACLGDEEHGVRGAAVTLMQRTGTAAADAVLSELDDEDYRTRANAAMVLGRIGVERHRERLERLKTEDEHSTVRKNASRALSSLARRIR